MNILQDDTLTNNDGTLNLQDEPTMPGEMEPFTNPDEDADADITDEELALLDATEEGEEDDELHAAELDDVDEEGEALNEETDLSGDDLDVPGSEDDDENEMIGEEDEENNSYSLKGDNEDVDEDII